MPTGEPRDISRSAPQLIDPFGRTVRDLRISVTDRCNFRCTYCMPEEGMKWLPRQEVLSYEELRRVAKVCVDRFGVDGIRLTGGEPTVRADLPTLVAMLHAIAPGLDLSLTTNALKLRTMAPALRDAGLRRVNISLDTLVRERFHAIARRDRLHDSLHQPRPAAGPGDGEPGGRPLEGTRHL